MCLYESVIKRRKGGREGGGEEGREEGRKKANRKPVSISSGVLGGLLSYNKDP